MKLRFVCFLTAAAALLLSMVAPLKIAAAQSGCPGIGEGANSPEQISRGMIEKLEPERAAIIDAGLAKMANIAVCSAEQCAEYALQVAEKLLNSEEQRVRAWGVHFAEQFLRLKRCEKSTGRSRVLFLISRTASDPSPIVRYKVIEAYTEVKDDRLHVEAEKMWFALIPEADGVWVYVYDRWERLIFLLTRIMPQLKPDLYQVDPETWAKNVEPDDLHWMFNVGLSQLKPFSPQARQWFISYSQKPGISPEVRGYIETILQSTLHLEARKSFGRR